MKSAFFSLWIACLVGWGDEFINLTFDEPNLANVRLFKPPGTQFERQYAPVEEVFQGWNISQDFLDALAISKYQGLANVDAGESPISLMPFSTLANTPPYLAAVGRYLPDPAFRPAFTLSRVVTVPDWARAFEFYHFGDEVSVLLVNGQEVAVYKVGENTLLYGVNMSPYTGSEVELAFEFPAGQGHGLDIIGFQPIPEPSPAALLLVGGALLLAVRRRRKHPTRLHSCSRPPGGPRKWP